MVRWQARHLLPLALVAAFASGAAPAAPRDTPVDAEAQRAYIEASYLIAPRKLGRFTLENASFDPANKYAGAGFRYLADGHQETRIDVYVYPAGRMPAAQALQHGLDLFEQDMRTAAEAGVYANVAAGPVVEFAIEPPAQAGRKPPANDFDAKVAAALADAGRLDGRKVGITLDLKPQGWPMFSSMHLFYKQLYFFKVRASAAQQRIAIDDFNALADEAARQLVPAIEAAHVGACANPAITLDAEADTEQAALELVRQLSVVQGYNCHQSAQDAGIQRKSADAEVVEIAYQAQEWKAE